MRQRSHFVPNDIFTTRRLLSRKTYAQNQTPVLQSAIRQQLAYWRTLGLPQFKRLTQLDMTNDVKPVYHPCQLTWNSVFLTFSAVTQLCSVQSRQTILGYLIRLFPNVSQVDLCKETHQNGSFHYHVLLRFAPDVYIVLNAGSGQNLDFNKELFPHYAAHPVYSIPDALAYIQKEDAYSVHWTREQPIPPYQLVPIVVQPQQIPVEPEAVQQPQQAISSLEVPGSLAAILAAYEFTDLTDLTRLLLDAYAFVGRQPPTHHAFSVALKLIKRK